MSRSHSAPALLFVMVASVVLYLSIGGQTKAQPESGAKIILYFEPDFQGPSLEVTRSLIDMPVLEAENDVAVDWNDQVRSIIVESGTWRLYQNGRCGTQLDDTRIEELDISTKEKAEGWSCVVSPTSTGPLFIPSPSAGGFAHDISSIELLSAESLPDWALPRRP